jgi:hypothetical protein
MTTSIIMDSTPQRPQGHHGTHVVEHPADRCCSPSSQVNVQNIVKGNLFLFPSPSVG